MTADALRVAQGTVRCGICSASFNALDYLSEQPVSHPVTTVADDTITVEEFTDSEIIELSTAAEAIAEDASGYIDLSGENLMPGSLAAGPDESLDALARYDADRPAGDASDAPPREADTPDDEDSAADEAAASGAGSDELDDLPDSALEFHGTAEDLDRLFSREQSAPATGSGAKDGRVEDLGAAIARISAADLSGIEVVEEQLPGSITDEPGPFDPDPSQIAAVLAFQRRNEDAAAAEPGPRDADEPAASTSRFLGLEDEPADDADRTDEFPILVLDQDDEAGRFVDPDAGRTPPRARPTGRAAPPADDGDAAETVYPMPLDFRRDPGLTGAFDADQALDSESPAPSTRRPLKIAAAVALGLVLAAQAVHFWRDDLAKSPLTGPWLLGTYQWLGLDVDTPTDLNAFDLRQWGAASDPAQPGRLRLRASIVNRAAFAQPYPLLRLSLQDRFGTTIGTRDVRPDEYLPGGGGAGLLGAAERADAEIVFVDPGREAVGFELAVCLDSAAGIRCAGDAGVPQS